MIRKLILTGMYIGMYFLFLSQVVDPNGNIWENGCTATEPFDETGFATAYFNDPNDDCITDDFLVIFTYGDGHTEPWTPYNQFLNDPDSGGNYNFNNGFWGCCNGDANQDLSGGSGSGGENPETCPCEWEVNETGFLIVDCPSEC